MEPQNYCLKWKKQEEQFQKTLVKYIDSQLMCDVTIASDGEVLNAHQIVLSACSSYFENILSKVPNNNHPIIILKDITSLELKILINYMYRGQAVVPRDLLPRFLKTCEYLKIHGLCQPTNANSQEAEEKVNDNTGKSLTKKPTLNDITHTPTHTQTQSLSNSRKRNGLLLLANERRKKKQKKNISDPSQTLPSQETNKTCSDLSRTNENCMHDQTTGQSLENQQPLQENEINRNTISKEAGTTETFPNKSVDLEKSVKVPATSSTHITQEVNQSVNKETTPSSLQMLDQTTGQSLVNQQPQHENEHYTISTEAGPTETLLATNNTHITQDVNQNLDEKTRKGSILDSPVYDTQLSFIFDVQNVALSKPIQQDDSSSQCIIIDDVPEVVEISDDEDNDNNVEMQDLGRFRNSVDHSAVKLNAETQKDILKDVNLNRAQDSESDDSEIKSQFSYIKRNRVQIDNNISDDISRIFFQDTEPFQENNKNEALKRAQHMKIVLEKESYSHFKNKMSGSGTNRTSSPEIGSLEVTVKFPEKQNDAPHIFPNSSNKDDHQDSIVEENVESAGDSEEQNQLLKSLNLVKVKKGVVEKAANEKSPRKLLKRRLRPRTPKPTNKES